MKVSFYLKTWCAALCCQAFTVSCSSSDDEGQSLKADFTTKVEGYKAAFINLSENGTSYHWDFGDGEESTLKDPEHTYAAGGNFEVVLKVTNASESNEVVKTIKIEERYLGDRITIDGKFKDWADISSFKPTEGDALTQLKEIKVASDNQNIYVYAKVNKETFESGVISVFFDYDLSAATGYKPWFANGGFESFAQASIDARDASLYFYVGAPGEANWMWEEIVSAGSGFNTWGNTQETGDNIEAEFSLEKNKIQGMNNKSVGLYLYLEKEWAVQGLIPSTAEKPILLNLETGIASAQN